MRTPSLLRLALLLITLMLSACDLVEFSPYDDKVDSDFKDLTKLNLSRLSNSLSTAEKDSFDFAVISDTHIDYDELHKAVKWINNCPRIKLLVHLGDQTDTGLKYEYENTARELQNLNIPYIVVIGNHDYLSQGSRIYSKIYGPKNFSFTVGSNKFIAFDDVVWENNNSKPDFIWLKNELSGWQGNQFLLMHIPESSDQMESYQAEYQSTISGTPGLIRLHGHTHSFLNNWPQLTTGRLKDGLICIISVRKNTVSFRMESYK